jgi:hypothetical protein
LAAGDICHVARNKIGSSGGLIEWASLRFVVKFFAHIVLGTIVFALVAAVAVYLHKFMSWLIGTDPALGYIASAVQGVEIFLFAVDLICLVAFVIKEGILLMRELWTGARGR